MEAGFFYVCELELLKSLTPKCFVALYLNKLFGTIHLQISRCDAPEF